MTTDKDQGFFNWRHDDSGAVRRFEVSSPLLMLVPTLLMAIILCSAARSATAQSEGTVEWSKPKLIHSTDGDISQPSEIVADSFGRVHIFWSESPFSADGDQSSYYINYSRGEGGRWTRPVDILSSPGGRSALMPKAAVDSADILHLVWQSPAAVDYSSAPASTAESANNWSRPELFSDKRPVEITSFIDAKEQLHVAYAVWKNGIYYQQYDVLSGLLNNPVRVGGRMASDSSPNVPLLSVSEDGTIHMLWTEVTVDGAGPLAVFYSRSETGGESWSPPQLLLEGGFRAEDVALNGSEVHVLLLGSASVRTRGHLWSPDGGLTWSSFNEIVDAAQGAGRSHGGIVIDDDGRVFAAFGMFNDTAVGFASWDGSRWSEPQVLPGLSGSSFEDVRLAVSGGNRLHAIFVDAHQKLWYSEGTTQSQARPTPAATLPIPGTIETAASVADSTPEPTATESALQAFDDTGEVTNPFLPLYAGGFAAFACASILVLVLMRRQHNVGTRR